MLGQRAKREIEALPKEVVTTRWRGSREAGPAHFVNFVSPGTDKSSSDLSEIRRFAVGSPRNGALSLTTFEMQFAGSQHKIDPQVGRAKRHKIATPIWRAPGPIEFW